MLTTGHPPFLSPVVVGRDCVVWGCVCGAVPGGGGARTARLFDDEAGLQSLRTATQTMTRPTLQTATQPLSSPTPPSPHEFVVSPLPKVEGSVIKTF